MKSDVKVTVCGSNQLLRAQGLLIENSPESQDSSGSTAPSEFILDGENILVAEQDGELHGAIYFQLGNGRVGWMWAPVIVENLSSFERDKIARALGMEAARRLAWQGARLIQILLRPSDRRARILEQCGFRRITEMVQMERRTTNAPDTKWTEGTQEVEFVSFTESLSDDLRRVVQETYEGSLDCSELDGIRPVREVLEGYRSAGEFRDNFWALARTDSDFAGCVLLSFSREFSSAVLQYMGVIPTFRRRGIGRRLLHHALRVAHEAGAGTISLAVDIRNHFAMRLYRGAGFEETDRRSVFIMRVDARAMQ